MNGVKTSEMDVKIEPVNVELWTFLYWNIFKRLTTFNETVFCEKRKNTNMGGGAEFSN
jgi:hypothetical protein